MAEVDRDAFGEASTTMDVLSGIDLSGKVAFVTGGAGGLGTETARALLSAGAQVTIAVRDVAKGAEAVEAIRQSAGRSSIELVQMDLSVPDSVRAGAKGWLETHDALHLLINNAGIMACPLMRTVEGWEMQFATNHLGHFILTGLLAPALRAAAPSRIVNLSSAGHRMGDVDFADLHFDGREYDKWAAYGQSKTANILFTIELDQRLKAKGVRAYAVHPGVIMTELARHLSPDDITELMSKARGDEVLKFKTAEAGAATTVYAATALELQDRGGLYLEDCHVAAVATSEDAPDGYAAYAMDALSAGRLWEVSESLVGERFDL